MDSQSLFYSLGILYFFISLILIITFGIFFLSFYLKLKKQINEFKNGYSYLSKAKSLIGKLPPVAASVLAVIIGVLIKNLKDRSNKKNS